MIEESGVLVAGDMLSDIPIPFPDLDAANPIEDYLVGLRLLESVADDVDVLIPGHGSVGGADQVRRRIELDRAYVHALRDGNDPDDPRIGPSATFGKDWLPSVYEWQLQQLAKKRARRDIGIEIRLRASCRARWPFEHGLSSLCVSRPGN